MNHLESTTHVPSTTLKYYDGSVNQIQQRYNLPNHKWLHRPQSSNDSLATQTNKPTQPTQPTQQNHSDNQPPNQPLNPVQSYNHIGFNNKSMCRTKYDSQPNYNNTRQYIPHGCNICPDQGIGDINTLNELRTGEHSRIEGYRYGEFVNDMFLDIERTNVFINTSVMPFPRGGFSTRKLNRENSNPASNNI